VKFYLLSKACSKLSPVQLFIHSNSRIAIVLFNLIKRITQNKPNKDIIEYTERSLMSLAAAVAREKSKVGDATAAKGDSHRATNHLALRAKLAVHENFQASSAL